MDGCLRDVQWLRSRRNCRYFTFAQCGYNASSQEKRGPLSLHVLGNKLLDEGRRVEDSGPFGSSSSVIWRPLGALPKDGALRGARARICPFQTFVGFDSG
uniref:Uncharacterized protein n=1 Tax=Cacopsylla melanoneura TaxID=428564 RepID=A0A8D8ZVZ5_9HEMI